MKTTYSEKLKSPKWQKKRLEILNIHGFKCDICKAEDKTIHVHHRFYIKGREPWEYDNDVFQVLCERCHNSHHKESEIIGKYNEILEKYEDLETGLEIILFRIRELEVYFEKKPTGKVEPKKKMYYDLEENPPF